jgi:hypothetical protein
VRTSDSPQTAAYGWITVYPHLAACCSTRAVMPQRTAGFGNRDPLRIKWQNWIALGGRIIVHRECRQWQHNVALSGSIPLPPAHLGKPSFNSTVPHLKPRSGEWSGAGGKAVHLVILKS